MQQGSNPQPLSSYTNTHHLAKLAICMQGFPLGGDMWEGGNLGKMATNCMKITKSTFLGQKSRRHGRIRQFLG